MRTIQLLVLLLLVFTFNSSIHTVYAANVPERSGAVTDPAGLFTVEQVKQLRETLQDQSFELVVVTAKGLDEEAIQQFGNDVYNTWKLGANQLLLVVTDKPGTAQLVYDNEQMAKAVSRTDAGNAQGIIDLQYKPLAAKGSMIEGIKSVSNYVNGLNVPVTKEPSPQPVPSGVGVTPPVQPSASEGAPGSVTPVPPKGETPTAPVASSPSGHVGGTGASDGANPNSSWTASIVTIIVSILIVIGGIVYMIMMKRSRRT
ncbi:TPM domain-containing protein [Paenibacillus sp. WQ 127069]|uniref:TPM domain-containing protein n=1 Tax=Paenibacillus baimaensis TaxID=2982185 RepID=A0ABT2URC9_9BACL|nr:TPM domain-containing protein [Paenibacillus sp. WQ 127069]MCU6797092.1 TPM domain-containing protein [Paenibacillus sp. WQ 127069]